MSPDLNFEDLPVPVVDKKELSRKAKDDRAEWIRSLGIPNSAESLFQIESLLTAVDRFCRPGELAILGTGLANEGFKKELEVAVRAVRKALTLSRHLQNNHDTSVILFDRFVEGSLLPDGTRDRYWQLRFEQETPRDSFTLFDATLEHISDIGGGLLESGHVSGAVLRSYSMVLKSSLYANRYFNPFLDRGFSDLYDRIDHPLIVRTVEAIKDESARHAAGVMILMAMRFLRYLALIQPQSLDFSTLQDSLPLFALLRSDMNAATPVFNNRVKDFLQRSKDPVTGRLLEEISEALSFQYSLEGNKVFDQILLRAMDHSNRETLLGAVETAHGILTNFVQQSIVSLVQTTRPTVRGRDLFTDFVSRLEQSIRLREDVWILHQLVMRTKIIIDKNPDNFASSRKGLSDYLDYFQSFAIKNIRASDLPTFQVCLERLREASRADLTQSDVSSQFVQDIHKYKIFLETVLQHLGQRSDLQEVPFDTKHAHEILLQFIPDGMEEL